MIVCRGFDNGRTMWWWEAVNAIEVMMLLKEGLRSTFLFIGEIRRPHEYHVEILVGKSGGWAQALLDG